MRMIKRYWRALLNADEPGLAHEANRIDTVIAIVAFIGVVLMLAINAYHYYH